MTDETAEEERLMKYISSTTRGRSTSQKFKKPANVPLQSPVVPVENPARKWNQGGSNQVDPELLRKAAEAEKKRERELQYQADLDKQLLERAQSKAAKNDFTIDRYLIKTEEPQQLKSAPPHEERKGTTSPRVSDEDAILAKEEQRLLKKVGGVAPPKPKTQIDNAKHADDDKATLLASTLRATRYCKFSDVSTTHDLTNWIAHLVIYSAKLRQFLNTSVSTRKTGAAFQYDLFEATMLNFVHFLYDNLVLLHDANAKKSTAETCSHLLDTSADLVQLIGSASVWNGEIDDKAREVLKITQSILSTLLPRAEEQERLEEKKSARRHEISLALIEASGDAQELAHELNDYDSSKLKNHLQSIVNHTRSVYNYFSEDQVEELLDRTRSLIGAAKSLADSDGEDPRERTNLENKLVLLISDVYKYRDAI